ncbi:Rha family transcriptional regulator [Segatella copri]|uniref:Rha family transcriptional regulator n=1 Tax=Segatella copri TaxID=165179 RepID=UPI00222FEDBE|nr:Rha family transcriptional regulator [Segatella copri]MCW4101517.1 Rha family transcriptional regulator [Segatella copri]
MSSLEIAEVTGKEHKNVMRDIQTLLSQGVDKLNFERISYKDSMNRVRDAYQLTYKGVLILASGYNPVLREKIINRWEELETGKTEPKFSQQSPSQPQLSDKIQAANFLADFLNLNGASKLAIAKSIADPLGLPTPDYAMDEKTVHAAKDLLADHKVKMSSAEFNKILVSKGIVERMTRPGKGGKTHSWVVIPEKYSNFGQNARNPHAQNQTQALWYDSKFSELLSLAGIQEGKEEESHD